MTKLFLIMLGGPGAGKGTQCELIGKYLKSTAHISTGDCIRAEINKRSEIGLKVEDLIKNGQLISDDIVFSMVNNFIQNCDKEVIIFDGYPRSVGQLDTLLELCTKGIKVLVINLEIHDEVLVARILERGKHSGRSDDNREAAAKRLQVYHAKHDDMINEIKEKKLPYYVVDNEGSIEEVFEDIKAIFEKIDLH